MTVLKTYAEHLGFGSKNSNYINLPVLKARYLYIITTILLYHYNLSAYNYF